MSASSEHKKTSSRLRTASVVIGLLLVAVAIAGFLFQDKIKTAVAEINTSFEHQGKPKFMFDTATFSDWATAGNVYTDVSNIAEGAEVNKDNLPISNIHISQCEDGSNCNDLVKKCEPWSDDKPSCKELAQSTINTPCFVMAFYNERKIDPDKEVTKYIEHAKSFDGMVIQEAGAKTVTMKTSEGDKEYKLHYYDYDSKGSDSIKHGNAIGYVSLADGHIDIRSVCSETSQLDKTLPVLSAISLE